MSEDKSIIEQRKSAVEQFRRDNPLTDDVHHNEEIRDSVNMIILGYMGYTPGMGLFFTEEGRKRIAAKMPKNE